MRRSESTGTTGSVDFADAALLEAAAEVLRVVADAEAAFLAVDAAVEAEALAFVAAALTVADADSAFFLTDAAVLFVDAARVVFLTGSGASSAVLGAVVSAFFLGRLVAVAVVAVFVLIFFLGTAATSPAPVSDLAFERVVVEACRIACRTGIGKALPVAVSPVLFQQPAHFARACVFILIPNRDISRAYRRGRMKFRGSAER